MKTRDNEYWYFRAVADEDGDDGVYASIAIPLKSIRGIVPTGTELIKIYFQHSTTDLAIVERTSGLNGFVLLNVTAGQSESIIHKLVANINGGPRANPSGVTTIADDTTTDFDNTTRSPVYFHSGITSIALINGR